MANEGEREQPKGDAPAHSASHAGARTSLTVAERVGHIVGMMERLEWERGRSAPRLAEQWGLAKDTVEGHAAEAHRLVTADKDEAIRDITAGARSLMRQALQAGDQRAFAAVANLLADVSGAKAPVKQEHAIGPINSATAASFVREAFGEKALPRDLDTEDAPEPGDVPEEPPTD